MAACPANPAVIISYRRPRRDTAALRGRAVSLYVAGMSSVDVGRMLDVSRERVRQYLVESGVVTRHMSWRNSDPVAVMRALRTPGVESFKQASRVAPGISVTSIAIAVRVLGCEVAIRRLFRLRERWRLLADLQRVAKALGRTPTAMDMNKRVGGLAISSTFQRVFGRVTNAQRSAGLRARERGYRGRDV